MKKHFSVLAPLILIACTPETVAPPPALQGTVWVAEEIDRAPVVDNTQVTIQFMDEGRIAGRGGCNNYFGGYTLDATAVEIGQIGATKMACDGPVMQQEDKFFTLLAQIKGYAISGDGVLNLRADDGRTIRFKAERKE